MHNISIPKDFVAGWLFSIGMRSLEQDLIGKAEYIRRMDAGWGSAQYTVPLAAFFIAVSLWMVTWKEKP